MEDEDNDFLAGVIEFGDGTQYTVQPAPPPPTTQPAEYSSPASAADSLAPPAPVTKEERFQDDFDRSWPRSSQSRFDHPGPPPPKTWKPAPSPTTSIRDLPPHQQPHPPPPPSIGASSTTSASTRDVGEKRVLFNERSNKLEPYGKPPPQNALGRRNAPPQPQSIAIEQRPSSPPHPQQRQSRFGPPHPHSGREGPSSFGRDLPPHANFQTGGGHKPPGLAPPTMNGAPPFSHGEPHERERERERGRRDGHHGPPGMARTENIPPPPSQPGPNFRRDRSRGRDDYRGHRDGPPPIFLRDRSRDEGRFHPGATGKMGPPPLPLPPPVPKSSDDNIVVTPTSVAVTSTVQSAPVCPGEAYLY
jgi:serine/arginine repetitive matrix protein 2